MSDVPLVLKRKIDPEDVTYDRGLHKLYEHFGSFVLMEDFLKESLEDLDKRNQLQEIVGGLPWTYSCVLDLLSVLRPLHDLRYKLG